MFRKAGLDSIVGTFMTQFWFPYLDSAQNKKFVARFRKRNKGIYPAFYAAQACDAVYLIKSAIDAVKGDMSNTDGFRAALEKANFPSRIPAWLSPIARRRTPRTANFKRSRRNGIGRGGVSASPLPCLFDNLTGRPPRMEK